MKRTWFEEKPHPFFEPTWYDPTPYDDWNIKSRDLYFEPAWYAPASNDKETIKDVFNTFTEKQKKVVYFMTSQALTGTGFKFTGKLTSEGLKIFEKEIETNMEKKYTPKKIIVNGPATIVMWNDGTKTVVKCENDYPYANAYDAFNAALAKKIFGTNSHLKKVINQAIELQIPKIKVDSNVETTPNETLSEALDKVSDAFRKIWEVKNDGESK